MRICGKDNSECFITDPRQVTCLADMLINKVYGLAAVLDMLRAEGLSQMGEELLDESQGITTDIINWVKYLQASRDIIGNATEAGVEGEDRRNHIRFYGMNSIGNITLKVSVDDRPEGKPGLDTPFEATIVNFSSKGIQFVTETPMAVGDSLSAELSSEQIGKSVSFKAVVRYIAEHEDSLIAGASIETVGNQSDFNLFRSLMGFIAQTSAKLTPPL